ncbi:hypothetical protein BDZ97DRAFT_839162 [Flammula alnicola]|nr:hypothetical protein BDZ97DRAFT_839162 [Flammula alnicola]
MLFTAIKHSNNLQRYYPRRSYLPPVISRDPVHRLCTGYLQLHVGSSRNPSCHLLVSTHPTCLMPTRVLWRRCPVRITIRPRPSQTSIVLSFPSLKSAPASYLYSQNAQNKSPFPRSLRYFRYLEPSSAAYRLEGLGTAPINRPQPRPLPASLLIFIIL